MKWKAFENGFHLRLMRGEPLMAQIAEFALSQKIPSAVVTGLGAIEKVRLGYYNLQTKSYVERLFKEDHELVSLMGNISYLEGKPIVHAHATISDSEQRAYAGHLFEAHVAVTVEVSLFQTNVPLQRKMDPEVGLNLLDL